MDTILFERLVSDPTITGFVGNRIFPTRPTGDTVLPHIVYTLNGAENFFHLQGVASFSRYDYTIEYWSIDQLPNLQLADAITARLDGWRDLSDLVQGSFRTSMSDEFEEAGYHGVQTYSIFGP